MSSLKRAAHASALSILASCLYLAGAGAIAQEQGPPSPPAADEPSTPASPAAPTAQVDQQKIEKFADAYVAVQDIQTKATAKLQTTQNAEEAQQVKTAAESEMIQAVEKTGLKVDEFNQITEQMASDLTLRNKVSAEIEKRRS